MSSSPIPAPPQDASATVRGLVSTGAQTFAGVKTFNSAPVIPNLSGTNTGDLTLAAVGSSPNGNGASLAGQVLTLQVADGTHPGAVSTAAQTFGGDKTFTGNVAANGYSSPGFSVSSGNLNCLAITYSGSAFASSGQVANLYGQQADSASAVGARFGGFSAYATAGAKLASFTNGFGGTEKSYLDKDGNWVAAGSFTSLVTANNIAISLANQAHIAWSSGHYITFDGTAFDVISNGGLMLRADRTGPTVQAFAGGAALTGFDLTGVLARVTTAVGNTTGGTNDLQTYAMPGSTMTITGRGVRIRAWGTTANNANAKTVQIVFGGTVVASKQLAASIAGVWEFDVIVLRTGSSTQKFLGHALNHGGTTLAAADGATVWAQVTANTAAETETSTINVKTQSTAATSANDIVSQGLLVEYV